MIWFNLSANLAITSFYISIEVRHLTITNTLLRIQGDLPIDRSIELIDGKNIKDNQSNSNTKNRALTCNWSNLDLNSHNKCCHRFSLAPHNWCIVVHCCYRDYRKPCLFLDFRKLACKREKCRTKSVCILSASVVIFRFFVCYSLAVFSVAFHFSINLRCLCIYAYFKLKTCAQRWCFIEPFLWYSLHC